MPDAPTNAGKHVSSNIASARSQRYTKYSVFWLAHKTLCVMTLRNFLHRTSFQVLFQVNCRYVNFLGTLVFLFSDNWPGLKYKNIQLLIRIVIIA